jgi:subfamily B ATP-binding cassette protein MsbA
MNGNISNPRQVIDSSTWSLIKALSGKYVRPYRRRLVAALLSMAFASAMTAAFAKLIEPVLDKVLVAGNENLIVPMAFAVFAVFVLNGIATYIHTVLLNTMGQAIVADIQRDLFNHFMTLDLAFFHENTSGQLIARLISDVNVVRSAVADSLTGIGKSLLTLILLVGLMFSQDWKLALIAACVFPPAGWFVSYLGKKLRRLSGGIQREIGDLSDFLSQTFQGIRQVKAYGMERYECKRSQDAVNRVKYMSFKGVRIGNLSTPFNETLIGLALMGVITYGGFQVAGGHLTVGELMSFIAAFALAYDPLKRLAKLNNTLQTGLGASERILEMFHFVPVIVDRPDAKALQADAPEIVFKNVSFGYANREEQALKHINLVIPQGKVTALVGPSGGGKTTILNMIPRFYDVAEGAILVNGTDIRDVTMASLRRHIALVSQDVTIFDDTVRANIAYGLEGATEEQIIAAAKAAAADDFIRTLPEGYDTRLGEHGLRLSGGQRQRISIARAILRDAPILLLDEATSALDNESERLIQASLERLQQGRTTLVIAHRLSTVQKADQIVVLKGGEIVETGTHQTLLGQSGIYAHMYSLGLAA